jgi:hypothetical protein
MPISENGHRTVAATLQLVPTRDPRRLELHIEGRRAGSVRYTPRGWMPIGGFVFAPGLAPICFRTPEEAALALATNRLRHRARLRAASANITTQSKNKGERG